MQQNDAESSPPKKKRRSSCTQEAQCSFTGDQDLRMQHIGELFVYLDKSVRPEGMLGFIIDKTWVINFKLKIFSSPRQSRGELLLYPRDWRWCPDLFKVLYNIL